MTWKIFIKILKNTFAFPKNIRLNSTHNFDMKIPNKRELQQIALNLYKKCTAKPYYFLVVDATLSSDNFYVAEKIL